MAATIDVRAMADDVELILRWTLVYLGVPEQPDSYWNDMAADLTADLGEAAVMCLNACAVMADASQLADMLTEES
jgi:hypothetical protein